MYGIHLGAWGWFGPFGRLGFWDIPLFMSYDSVPAEKGTESNGSLRTISTQRTLGTGEMSGQARWALWGGVYVY